MWKNCYNELYVIIFSWEWLGLNMRNKLTHPYIYASFLLQCVDFIFNYLIFNLDLQAMKGNLKIFYLWKLLYDCVWWLDDEWISMKKKSTHKNLHDLTAHRFMWFYLMTYVHNEKVIDNYILYIKHLYYNELKVRFIF